MVGARRRGMTALIVEDDAGVSDLGAAMLREFDLAVEQVQSAEAAIAYLARCGGDIAVLIADVHLAGEMDGLSLIHRVAVLWPAISLIVTTGDLEARLDDLPARATFVPKPWRALDIVAAAERAARADHSVHAVIL